MADSLEGMSPEKISELARWAHRVSTDPQTREDAIRMTQKINPNFRSPELDTKDMVTKATDDLRKDNEKLREEMRLDAARRDRADLTRDLKAKGFDIVAVEKVMEDNHIADYSVACKFMRQEALLAPATPSSVSSSNADMPEDFKGIAKNPGKWARDMAAKVATEFRQGLVQA